MGEATELAGLFPAELLTLPSLHLELLEPVGVFAFDPRCSGFGPFANRHDLVLHCGDGRHWGEVPVGSRL